MFLDSKRGEGRHREAGKKNSPRLPVPTSSSQSERKIDMQFKINEGGNSIAVPKKIVIQHCESIHVAKRQ